MPLPVPTTPVHPLILRAKRDAEITFNTLVEKYGYLPADAELKIRMMLDARMATQAAKGAKS